jgi:hypothetical protein
MKNYAYPVGDFLSGFSDDLKNPCDYELECQRMVIRGVQYLDDNEELFALITMFKLRVNDDRLKPMIEYMCLHEDKPEESQGQTGAMVTHTTKVAYHAKKMGWENYIEMITESNIGHNIPQE